MANPLRGIAQGTTETIQQAAKDVGRKALSTMPSPSKGLYSIGLGVGPLIRNIVEASKEKNRTSGGTDAPVSKKEFMDVTRDSINQTTQLIQLTKVSVSLLKEIKTALAKGNRGEARTTVAPRATTMAARPIVGRVMPGVAQDQKTVSNITAGATKAADAVNPILTGLLLAGGATAIWDLLPDDIKGELRKSAIQFADTVGKETVSGITGLLKEAWSSNATATTIAGLAVAQMTGLLGVAFGIAKGTFEAGKGIYQFSKAITGPTVAPGGTAPAGAPGGTAPAGAPTTTGVGNAIRRALGIEESLKATGGAPENIGKKSPLRDITAEYKDLKKYTTPQYADEVFANKYGAKNLEAIKAGDMIKGAPAGAAVVGDAAEGASKGMKAAKLLGKVGLVGTAASLGMSAYEYNKTDEQEKQGLLTAEAAGVKKGGIAGEAVGGLAAGLYGAGKGAVIGTMIAPGVGTVVGGVVGGIAGGVAGSKLGKYAGEGYGRLKNMFRGSSSSAAPAPAPAPSPGASGGPTTTADGTAGTQGPNPTGTQLSAAGKIPGVDNDRLLQLTRQFESSGQYGADNKVGFIGAYGLGSQALETFGLLKPGSSKGRDRGSNAAVYDPAAWAEGYSLQKFLQDKDLQDKVAMKLMKMNYDGLTRKGVINNTMSETDIASRLYTAWHGGVGGAAALFNEGKAREDFAFKGATTATSASKMAAAYGRGAGTTMAVAGKGVSPQAVQTASAQSGAALSQQQDMYSAMVSAIAGQNVTVNLNQVVQNALADASRGGGGGPLPSGPTTNNHALDRTFKAVL